MKLNIDRSNWKKVRLGDVATAPSIRINNPSESGFERFIGNANIGQWDFRLTSWESTSSVTSAMKGFETGDYLFVRRSLYASDFRERSPRASFSGICSGDIITIREIPEKIASGFLIGVLNSPAIWKYVVANASGSITRRIKWRDLANYEFLLPPKDQQSKLAELLWAADEVQQHKEALVTCLALQLRSTREYLINDSADVVLPLEELCKKRISYGIVQAGPHIEDGLPYIKSSDMKEDGINPNALQRTSEIIYAKYARSEVVPGELVFSLRGNLGEIQKVPEELERANLTQGTARLSPREEVSASYLMAAVRSGRVQRMISAFSKGSTFKEISLADLRKIKVPIHRSPGKQAEICETIATVTRALRSAKMDQGASAMLLKSLINQIF